MHVVAPYLPRLGHNGASLRRLGAFSVHARVVHGTWGMVFFKESNSSWMINRSILKSFIIPCFIKSSSMIFFLHISTGRNDFRNHDLGVRIGVVLTVDMVRHLHVVGDV